MGTTSLEELHEKVFGPIGTERRDEFIRYAKRFKRLIEQTYKNKKFYVLKNKLKKCTT